MPRLSLDRHRHRRNFLQLSAGAGAGLGAMAAAAALLLGSGVATAQTAADFPTRTVTIMTPFPPGAGPDAVARLVAERLSRLWKQSVQVENRPGGGGFIAMDVAKRAPADGYTMLLLDSEHIAAAPHLYKARNFKTYETFDPVAAIFETPFMIAVPSDSKWKSVGDLVSAAKSNNGKLLYGSWGVGSPGHLGGELLANRAGISMQHVPYREMSQLFMSVGTNDVNWSFASIPSSAGAYQAGKIRYLAIAAPARIPQMPDVPTVAEAGGPQGISVNSFTAFVVPKGTPAAVRQRIHDDVAKVLNETEVKARFYTFAFEPLYWSEAEIRTKSEERSKVYEELIRRANITLE